MIIILIEVYKENFQEKKKKNLFYSFISMNMIKISSKLCEKIL